MNTNARVANSPAPVAKKVRDLHSGNEVLVGKQKAFGTLTGRPRGGSVTCVVPAFGARAMTIPVEWVLAWWDGSQWVEVVQ